MRRFFPAVGIAGFLLLPLAAAPPNLVASAQEVVQQSVARTNADWNAAPRYSFTEHDVMTRAGKTTSRTYQVLMIAGSPYNKLIAVGGKPLPPAQQAAEETKLRNEIQKRKAETPAQRQKRMREYQNERRQDHALMREMVEAFQYKMLGQESLHGHTCYVLQASPKPGYRPKSRDTKVLTGMRGKMWIDTQQLQWVKVQAEVFRPVSFGLFIARVQPGTEFILENAPVGSNLWLPTHFVTRVQSRILLWSHNYVEDDTFSNYEQNPVSASR